MVILGLIGALINAFPAPNSPFPLSLSPSSSSPPSLTNLGISYLNYSLQILTIPNIQVLSRTYLLSQMWQTESLGCPHEPQFPSFMPLYNSLLLSVDKTCDMFLINRMRPR